jgi:hypothetical protein
VAFCHGLPGSISAVSAASYVPMVRSPNGEHSIAKETFFRLEEFFVGEIGIKLAELGVDLIFHRQFCNYIATKSSAARWQGVVGYGR